MDDLTKLRKDIQDIDLKILELFEKRMDCVLKIKNIKKIKQYPIEDSKFENEKKEFLLNHLNNLKLKDDYLELLEKYLEISKRIQMK